MLSQVPSNLKSSQYQMTEGRPSVPLQSLIWQVHFSERKSILL